MKNIFLLQRIGWDYDDNYYFRSEGSSPEKSYSSIELAEAALKRLELEYFMQRLECEDVEYYLYDENDLNKYKEQLSEILKDHPNISKLSGDSDEWDSFYSLLSDEDYEVSEDQILEIQKVFGLNFYEIVEVEFVHELS